MNADNVRLVLEDLESGQHPQTTRAMCRLDADGEVIGYCANGRICEVAIAHGLEVTVEAAVDARFHYRLYDGADLYPPKAVQEWLGISEADLVGNQAPREFYRDLGSLNDGGCSFPLVAEYIRLRLRDD